MSKENEGWKMSANRICDLEIALSFSVTIVCLKEE